MSSAYYNDNEPSSCAWLRELMAAGLIMKGTIDERSISEVTPDDLGGFTRCHWFAGIAGWDLALRYAGWPSDRPVWTASLPCHSFSCAGKGDGFADPRGRLWRPFARLVRECRPGTLFGEQVEAAIGHGWLDRVFSDLEDEGFACAAAVLPACAVGAPHRRQRLFWVAHAVAGQREQRARPQGDAVQRPADDCPTQRVAHAEHDGQYQPAGATSIAHKDRLHRGLHLGGHSYWSNGTTILCRDGKTRRFERQPVALDDGVPALLDAVRRAGTSEAEIAAALETFPLARNQPARVSLLRAYGNSIVVPLAAEFIRAAEESIP